ncbi:MAG: 50S ribosomal protein L21 [Caldilineaceae bacterium]|nr:50S ribosomal protein L21 [Caldilineaceae bacterium]
MHAVIRTGGKQYYVAAGDILEVDKLDGTVGDSITLGDVLLLAGAGDVTVGQPTIAGATVTAKITGQHRGQKIRVFRYRPKKRIRVRKGHRQYLTRLHIQSIRLADGTEYQIPTPATTVVKAAPVAETPVVEAPAVEEAPVVESTATAEAENKE